MFCGERDAMETDISAGVGGFSKSVKVKALAENIHDMPAIPMLADDAY